jgi:hypothetical protein
MKIMNNDASGNKELFEMKYAAAVQTIKEAIQRSQARALHVVNSEVLSLNYGIGRYISENSRHGFWGTGALAQISSQLQKEMPGLKGYSETSLKDMRTFYEEWAPLVNRQPVADELASASNQMPVASAGMIDERLMLREIRQPKTCMPRRKTATSRYSIRKLWQTYATSSCALGKTSCSFASNIE